MNFFIPADRAGRLHHLNNGVFFLGVSSQEKVYF